MNGLFKNFIVVYSILFKTRNIISVECSINRVIPSSNNQSLFRQQKVELIHDNLSDLNIAKKKLGPRAEPLDRTF